MNGSMKLALAALLVAGAANVFAVTAPATLNALSTQAKAAGYNSEGELYEACNPYCSAGKNALPTFGDKKRASKCATYCRLKSQDTTFKALDAKKAQKYQEAAEVLSDYAKKNNVSGFVPEKK